MLERLSRDPRETRRDGYIAPEMEFIRFSTEDVIATSGPESNYSAKNQAGSDVYGVWGIDCF